MKIFVYVMTHTGDPNELGVWGCKNCMGRKRSYPYKAVIGVGGVDAKDGNGFGFAHKVKWIGIGPHWTPMRVKGELRHKVTFDHFRSFEIRDADIPDIRKKASRLAARIRNAPRGFMELTLGQQQQAEELLELAKKAKPSPALAKHGAGTDEINRKDSCSRSAKNERQTIGETRCAR